MQGRAFGRVALTFFTVRTVVRPCKFSRPRKSFFIPPIVTLHRNVFVKTVLRAVASDVKSRPLSFSVEIEGFFCARSPGREAAVVLMVILAVYHYESVAPLKHLLRLRFRLAQPAQTQNLRVTAIWKPITRNEVQLCANSSHSLFTPLPTNGRLYTDSRHSSLDSEQGSSATIGLFPRPAHPNAPALAGGC